MPRPKPTPETLELARRVRAARIAAGFTTQAAAVATLGMPHQYLNLIENGRMIPSAPKLMNLILGLRLDPLDIFPEAASWSGKPAAERWPEGHPEAIRTVRSVGRPRVKQAEPTGRDPRRWPEGYVRTLTAPDVAAASDGDRDRDEDDTAIDRDLAS